MNKQKQLISVFNFLAEYLNVEEPKVEQPKVEETKVEETKVEPKNVVEQLLTDQTKNIVGLINKVESIDKKNSEISIITNRQNDSFRKKIKEIKDEFGAEIKTHEQECGNKDTYVGVDNEKKPVDKSLLWSDFIQRIGNQGISIEEQPDNNSTEMNLKFDVVPELRDYYMGSGGK